MFQDVNHTSLKTLNSNSQNEQTTILPFYAGHAETSRLTGLSRTHLYQLFNEGKIKTIALRAKGKTRGRRLFLIESVLQFLDNELAAQHPESPVGEGI